MLNTQNKINNTNKTISDVDSTLPDVIDFTDDPNNDSVDFTDDLDIEDDSYSHCPNCILNLSLQNDKFNAIMNRPSTSTYSFEKEISDLNSSSSVFKLLLAIDSKLRSSLPYKGKHAEEYTTEIEQLANNSSLHTLVFELSNVALEGSTMDNLLSATNLFMYIHLTLKKIKKIDLFLQKSALEFPLDITSATNLLKDLNSDPTNPKTYILRKKLCVFLSLKGYVLNINREDTSLLMEFYSLHLKNLFNQIHETLQCLQFENLINNSFSAYHFEAIASNIKKRAIDALKDIPVERNSKSCKKSLSL